MNFFRRNQYEPGVNRRKYQTALIAIGVLSVTCIGLAIGLFGGSTTDSSLRDTLREQAVEEYEAMVVSISQLSRIGGSNTWQQLADAQQHIYALTRLNEMTTILLSTDGGLAPADTLTTMRAAIVECESLMLAGRAIDGPLATLNAGVKAIGAALGQT